MKKYAVFDGKNNEVGRYETEEEVLKGLGLKIKSTDYIRLAARGILYRLNSYKIYELDK